MWLDDLIGYLSPEAGVKRGQARRALAVLKQRDYEGARSGRRAGGRVTKGTSANAETRKALADLRNRARDLVRNNPYAAKAVHVYSHNLVGCGILPAADTRSKEYNKKAMDAWREFSDTCDPSGQTDFYGLQELAASARFESGECLIVRRWRPSREQARVPLQIEVLEADHLDISRNSERVGDNIILQGIEFNRRGQRVAYWLYPEHPGNATAFYRGGLVSQRVDAKDVIHHYRRQRPGQDRGITAFAPALARMRDLDDYEEAELIRKQIAACLGLAVTQAEGPNGAKLGASETETDADGNSRTVEKLHPGMIGYFRPGETVTTISPPSDANYPDYMVKQLHALAAGLLMPYELLTGDLSRVNYSSLRAGMLDFRALIEKDRWLMFIPNVCNGVWRWFIEAAYIAGTLPRMEHGVKWTPPKFEMIDPLKDAMADQLLIRSGLKTWPQAVQEHGYEPAQQIAEIAEWFKLFDDSGVILDIDPRQTARSGMLQATQEKTQQKELSDADI